MQSRATKRAPSLTEVGLGASQLGNLYRVTSAEEVAETLDAAWDCGIRYFDTAPHYGLGLSERRLGDYLRRRPRREFVISTKVGRLLKPAPDAAHERDSEGFDVPADMTRVWDFSHDGILRSVEASLERTGLDRFDILYLHDPDDHFEQAASEGMNALIELREQGVTSAVGAGMNHAAPLAELIRRADVDIVMCASRLTLLDSSAHDELLPLALERDVAVVAAGVYNSGLLARARPAADARFDYQAAPQKQVTRAHSIADICEHYGVSLPAVAVAYSLRHPSVVSAVLGARGRNQVQANVARASIPIPQQLWRELAESHYIPEDFS